MFDDLHNLCVQKHSLSCTASTILLLLAPANDALTAVQSKIKIFHLSNSINGFVVLCLSAISQQLASFRLAKILLKIQFWVQSNINKKERCSMLCLHDKPTTTTKTLMLDSMLYIPTEKNKNRHFKSSVLGSIPHHSTYMKRKYVSHVEFAQQTNSDTKSLQCPSMFYVSVERKNHSHFKVLGLNPTSLNIYGKDKCLMQSLHDQPTLIPKVFNALNALQYKTLTF